MIYVYDVEIYPNFFCVTFRNIKNYDDLKIFIIYDKRNDLSSLLQFINQENLWLIGYNSYSYDNQIMNYVYKEYHNLLWKGPNEITYKLFSLSNDIIFNNVYEYKWPLPFKSIDLMKVGGLQKSLKSVAVNMNWHKIQDLPLSSKTIIESDQVDLIVQYNINDVDITVELYKKLLGRIKLRWDISNLYGIDVNSESDSGIANRLLLKLYCERSGRDRREVRNLGTDRELVNLREVIPEYIQFKTDRMKSFLETLKSEYVTKDSKFKKYVIIGNTKYDILKGGLHSNMPSELYKTNERYKIIDADVGSYYPNIMINNHIYPKHLGEEFIVVYKEIVAKRMLAKKEKRIDEAEALKITANSTYGKLGNAKHWLRDLKAMYAVTIIGQLTLLMLIEKLELNGVEIFYANTDGITAKVPHGDNRFWEICKEWENLTNYTLEYVEYDLMSISNVNDYMSLKTGYNKNATISELLSSGHLKQKGDFMTEMDLAKGYNMPIVAEALNKYFIYGKSIRDSIRECTDIYKFCCTKKVDKKFKIEYHTVAERDVIIEELSKTNRYYMSNSGFRLYKRNTEDKALTEICSESPVILFNDYKHYNDFQDYKINYNYYIKQAEKLLLPIVYGSSKLF